MRKLMYLLLLCSLVACQKRNDDVLAEQPAIKKIELHIHASETYIEPWLDSVNASVTVSIIKLNIADARSRIVWDTSFASCPLKQYPLLPQKHIIEKQVPLFEETEKLQVIYNIQYRYNGSASGDGHAEAVEKPFTFIDVTI